MTTKQASIGLTAFTAVLTVFVLTSSSGNQTETIPFKVIGSSILSINLLLCCMNFRSTSITNKRTLTLLTLLITVLYAVVFLFLLKQQG